MITKEGAKSNVRESGEKGDSGLEPVDDPNLDIPFSEGELEDAILEHYLEQSRKEKGRAA